MTRLRIFILAAIIFSILGLSLLKRGSVVDDGVSSGRLGAPLLEQQLDAANAPSGQEIAPGPRPKIIANSVGSNSALQKWASILADPSKASLRESLLPTEIDITKSAEIASEAIKGNPQAALTLYEIFSYCSATQANQELTVTRPQSCQNIPLNLNGDPMYWLRAAVKAGSSEAVLKMIDVARQSSKSRRSTSEREALVAETIETLKKTSRNGFPEALRLLSATYADGAVVPPDPIHEFAYLQIYVEAGGGLESSRRLDVLREQLRQGDYLQIRKIQEDLLHQ